jgi:phi13 family phage major tail protein
MAETGVRVGLRDLHYAILQQDDETGVTYSQPKLMSKAIQATINPTTNSQTLYADDGPSDVATALGEISVSLQVRDLPNDVLKEILGHTIDQNGVLIKKSTDVAPYVAIGFRSVKSNGKYRYVWLYKGKFRPQQDEYQTKQEQPAFQTPTIEGTFIRRDFDNAWQAVGDEDDAAFTKGDIWFDAVYDPNAPAG